MEIVKTTLGEWIKMATGSQLKPYKHNRGGRIFVRPMINHIKREFLLSGLQMRDVVVLPEPDGSWVQFVAHNRTKALVEMFESSDSRLTPEVLNYEMFVSVASNIDEALDVNQAHGFQISHKGRELLFDPHYYAGRLVDMTTSNAIERYERRVHLIDKWRGAIGAVLYTIGVKNSDGERRLAPLFQYLSYARRIVFKRGLLYARNASTAGEFASVESSDVERVERALISYLVLYESVLSKFNGSFKSVPFMRTILESTEFFSHYVCDAIGNKPALQKPDLADRIVAVSADLVRMVASMSSGSDVQKAENCKEINTLIRTAMKRGKKE